jgi:hypothetical protein
MKKMRVIISGIHYPMSMMRWFIRAFQRREDVELWTCGVFTGDRIPWAGGIRMPQRYVEAPNFALSANPVPKSVPFAVVAPHLPFEPDLFLQIDAGFHFKDRPKGRIVALLETDPHVLLPHYQEAKQYSDFVFNMQTPYMEKGDIYVPYAYDKEVHYPEDLPKEYDACLIGLHYPQRDTLVSRLRKLGLKVYYDLGLIFDEYRTIHNKSKIGLNWSSMLDLNARFWEMLAMGMPMVANHVPDANTSFVDGEHYRGFDTMDEAENKVMLLMKDKELREYIANTGHRKIMGGKNTYDDRVNELLEACKLK